MISICLCTFRRNEMLRQCLLSLLDMKTFLPYEVVLVDNDASGEARPVATELAPRFASRNVDLIYTVEPARGIATARNTALDCAKGGFIAMIDDDETASSEWLNCLWDAHVKHSVNGAVGPVLPVFADGFPKWQMGLFRPASPTASGTLLKGTECRTGNVLFARAGVQPAELRFDVDLSRTGGEDTELFSRLVSAGMKIVWAEKAVVSEIQPLSRSKISWHLRRCYRAGWGWSFLNRRNVGLLQALLLAVVWVLPALGKSMLRLPEAGDSRTLGLHVLRKLAEQAGKLGYFAGMRVHEYG